VISGSIQERWATKRVSILIRAVAGKTTLLRFEKIKPANIAAHATYTIDSKALLNGALPAIYHLKPIPNVWKINPIKRITANVIYSLSPILLRLKSSVKTRINNISPIKPYEGINLSKIKSLLESSSALTLLSAGIISDP
jgi:hypothetical protein